ncbi:hypothetical protein [Bacillus sp. PS06]|nr:hypothetical protein [Bacillus sp. PS06]MBD8071593.1 hypothetical protein [Bacillus sp. PS06]
MARFSNGGGDIVFPIFSLFNGLIAMGVGDIVIDLNYSKKVEMSKE